MDRPPRFPFVARSTAPILNWEPETGQIAVFENLDTIHFWWVEAPNHSLSLA